jgi:RNA polymerase sigma-70 factor (ECF subfamily)
LSDGLQLLQRARRWDESALTQIYDTFAPVIYRYIYRRIGNVQTAQDLTAETFQRFLEALKRASGPREHLSGWLYRVAHNLVVDYYRRAPKEPPTSLEFADPPVPATGEAEIVRAALAERTRVALRMLSPLQQQVVTLRFLESLSLQEVADILDKTVGSVKALQHRALTSLQRILEGSDEP